MEKKATTTGMIQVRDMTKIAIFTALLCILAPMSIPIGPVPISLTNLVIYLSLYILGMKKGTISFLIYLLLGLVGLPVFSGYAGGPAKLVGPTGGYLIGFIFIALIGGYMIDRWPEKYALHFIAYVASTALCYALGTAWFVYLMDCTVAYALGICVFPFIIGDLCKIAVAMFLGAQVRRQLRKANLA
ncbi:MAG: biotin transporter BioY [Lachnospiraceae bacterium]|nr:biotin transporter BioY [Lachnospiraceae bacterium]